MAHAMGAKTTGMSSGRPMPGMMSPINVPMRPTAMSMETPGLLLNRRPLEMPPQAYDGKYKGDGKVATTKGQRVKERKGKRDRARDVAIRLGRGAKPEDLPAKLKPIAFRIGKAYEMRMFRKARVMMEI